MHPGLQGCIHLLYSPRREPRPGDLLGVRRGIVRLTHRLDDRLVHQVCGWIVAGWAGLVGDNHFGAPQPDLSNQMGAELVESPAVVGSIPEVDDLSGGQSQPGLTQGEPPGGTSAGCPHADQRLVEPLGTIDGWARGHLQVAPAERLDHAQVPVIAGKPGEQLQGHVLGLAEDAQQCRPSAAGATPLPGLSAVGGGQDGAQLAHCPAVSVVHKAEAPDGQVLTRGEGGPGSTGVGAVQYPRARRSGHPNLRSDHGQGVEVELPGDPLGQVAVRGLPGHAQVGGEHHQPALPDQPSVDLRPDLGYQLHPGHRAEAESGCGGRLDSASPDGGRHAAAIGQNTLVGDQEITRHPAGRLPSRHRAPTPPAIVGEEDAGGKHRRRAADRPAVSWVEEADLLQCRQEQLGIAGPAVSSVAGGEHHAGAGV